jgi:hypothetical protein
MRWLWATGVCLSLSGLLLPARAEEVTWHAAPPRPTAADPSPAASGADSGVRPASFVVAPGVLPAWLKGPAAAEPGPVLVTDPASGPAANGDVPRPFHTAVSVPGEPPMGVTGPEGEPVGEQLGIEEPWGPARPGHRLEVNVEYLLWWARGSQLPPLVTTAPATVPEAVRGALGAPGTVLLFGNQAADGDSRSGIRAQATYWCGCDQCFGFELGGFVFEQVATNFGAGPDPNLVLARPIFNINQGIEDRQLTSTPGTRPGDQLKLLGSINVGTPSRFFGAEANFRGNLYADGCWRVDFLGGFRFLDLDEDLGITENVLSERAVPGVPIFNKGNRIVLSDNFDTRNRFFGGQVGTQVEWRSGRWSVQGRFQVALGVNSESINVAGSQLVTTPAGAQTMFNGGLLALPSNSGNFGRDRFAVVPQVGLKVSYQVTELLHVFVGYDFLYWGNVVRPAEQVDRSVDINQIPNFTNVFVPNPTGQSRPMLPFHETGFWAQGVNAGLELRY